MEELSYLEGLAVSEFGDYRLIWCEDLGYVMGLFETHLCPPRKGDWCRVWYEEGSAHPTGLQPSSEIARNAYGIIVQKCELLRVTPCPTFQHPDSREPCVTVFAQKVASQRDSLFVQLLSLVVEIPENLRESLSQSECGQFVATLQFTDSETMAPVMVDAVPFAERKGCVSRINEADNTCQISVGFDCFDVQPHVFKFAQCSSEDPFIVGLNVSVILSKKPDGAKQSILRFYSERRSTKETDSTFSLDMAKLRGKITVPKEVNSSKSAGSNLLTSNIKSSNIRVTFDSESPKVHPYDDYASTPYSVRNFIESEPRLRKPIDLLTKKKTLRSIMKKSDNVDIATRLADCHVSLGKHDPHNRDDCGCRPDWLHYVRQDPNPKDIKLEFVEPILLISRHTHKIGKPDEHQMWRGFAHVSFQGFIEFLPSTFTSPFVFKMGTWIEIINHELNFHEFILKRGTTCQKYSSFVTPEFRIQNSKYHQHVEVHVELIRYIDSGEYMNSTQFGLILIPYRFLEKYLPYPEKAHCQVFTAWIEPLPEILRVGIEMISWRASKIVFCREKSLEEHLADLVKKTNVTSEVSFSVGFENKKLEKKRARKEDKRMKRHLEARQNGQNYIPKCVRLDTIGDFLHYLESHDGFPAFVVEDVVLPCTHILKSQDKSKDKVRNLTRILAHELVISEQGKMLYKGLDGTDRFIQSLVQILNENSTFVDFDAEDDDFAHAYRGFISYYDVYDSSPDSS